MANKARLLSNIIANDRECGKVFHSIAKLNKTSANSLPAVTPVPNQVFATEHNRFGKDATIHFTKSASQFLEYLRELDHYITTTNASKGKQSPPLKFACYGYKDLDGDIVINSIDCPVYEEAYQQGFTKKSQIIEYIMQNMGSKDMSIENSARVFDYLRQSNFASPKPIGTDIVALMGTTKHASLEGDEYNCFTVGELAESVLPYYVPVNADGIISGTLAITPKTISEKYLLSRGSKDNIADYLQDGSIEVALISYAKSESTGYVTPTKITNVTKALAQTDKGLTPLKISSSTQPTSRIYKAQDNPEHTM